MMLLQNPDELGALLGVLFSAEQVRAITAPLEPAVIVAGAGSGKTTVMAARVAWLVGTGQVDPDAVLGLTFTRKAAAELAARITTSLARAGLDVLADGAGVQVSTYDAFAGRIVDDFGLYAGIDAGVRLIGDAERFRIASRVVADARGPLVALGQFTPVTVASRVLGLAAELKSHLVAPDALVERSERFLEELAAAPSTRFGNVPAEVATAIAVVRQRLELLTLVGAYEERKAELGCAEFADYLAWAAGLADQLPWLPPALRAQHGVVLLDEYQDTSAAQAVLLQRLFSGPDAEHGRGHPVMAVGDPCQGIYGWRGASASNIADFPQAFPRADDSAAASYSLAINRRSGTRILAVANDLAAHLTAPLIAPDDAPVGEVVAASFDTWPAEIAWLGDEISALHDTARVARWSDIAVLARRNKDVGEVYAGLSARGIPAEIVGIGGLLDVPAVADVVATLSVLSDALANAAVIRLLLSPRWAIGPVDLARLGARAAAGGRDDEPASLLEAAADAGDVANPEAGMSEEGARRVRLFAAEIARLRRWTNGALRELVVHIIATLGVELELRALGEPTTCLDAFVDVVAAYDEDDPDASLPGLLAYLEAERAEGVGLEQPAVSADDCVKLLSVHRAKGLEWPVVFLPGLADKVFPAVGTSTFLKNAALLPADLRGDAASIPQVLAVTGPGLKQYADEVRQTDRQSEDRLAYVAVTRAQRALYLSTHRWVADAKTPRAPSPYFAVAADHADRTVCDEEAGAENPLAGPPPQLAWPDLGDADAAARRREAAGWVAGRLAAPDDLAADDRAAYESWVRLADALVAQQRDDERRRHQVVAPDYLSVTGLGAAIRDPAAYAARLAIPAPSLTAPAARAGTDVHRWLERELAIAPALDESLDADTEQIPAHWVEAFRASPYGGTLPVAIETAFTLTLAGRVIRGRIDAVFPGRDGFAYQVVDWKTGDARRADPLQLACYRLAWAELRGVPLEQVDAVFYDLGRGRVVRPPGRLPGREELGRMLDDTWYGGPQGAIA